MFTEAIPSPQSHRWILNGHTTYFPTRRTLQSMPCHMSTWPALTLNSLQHPIIRIVQIWGIMSSLPANMSYSPNHAAYFQNYLCTPRLVNTNVVHYGTHHWFCQICKIGNTTCHSYALYYIKNSYIPYIFTYQFFSSQYWATSSQWLCKSIIWIVEGKSKLNAFTDDLAWKTLDIYTKPNIIIK